MSLFTLSERLEAAPKVAPVRTYGQLTRAFGLLMEGRGLACNVGDVVEVIGGDGVHVPAEVVGFRDDRLLMMPLGKSGGLGPGSWVRPVGATPTVAVGDALLGRVLDAHGEPIDGLPGGPALSLPHRAPLFAATVNPMRRRRILRPMGTGVRVLDALLTLGEGQRVGIFAGGGVGKSKLLGMIADHSEADVNVIALIGERGREVREFVERELGPEGLRKSVVVTATADQAPLLRLRGAYVATAVAEYFRARGRTVMLMMDSLTRFAMAQREVGLSVGEPPATKGYTPSVFAALPALVERAGMGTEGEGSITGIYTVLVEGDDLADPVADTLRATLDGHVVLSRDLASAGHFPAVEVSQSVSRIMVDVTDPAHLAAAQRVRAILAVYEEARDLITIGAYKKGNRPDLDRAVAMREDLDAFLTQPTGEAAPWEETLARLLRLAARAEG